MVFVNARMVDPQALKGDWECSLVPPGKKPTPYHPGTQGKKAQNGFRQEWKQVFCDARVKGGEAGVDDPESRYRIGVSFQIENYRKTHKFWLDSGDSLACSDLLDARDVFQHADLTGLDSGVPVQVPDGDSDGFNNPELDDPGSVYSVVVTTSVSKK
eukprot:CAMPEP_0184288716 /NCGR_PEP_ID=MMETSP1049-20130417/1179_1 /TAXON_ID=77928 /ORGANISM="Proteomonas sulcata, Strain CCMP704" /LENGTH=156 /DNA_ID=CAMNT_0026595219 /DNA_START=318 /DNA_END=789 /DNA_ORIENTATION=+